MILSIVVLVIGAVFFHDQVLAIFHGMTALEAMQTILTFVLHVVVVTILSYVAFTLPKIFKPWLQALRWKRHDARRNRLPRNQQAHSPKGPRLTTDQLLRLYMMQSMNKPRRDVPTSQSQDDIHLDF